MNNKYEINFNDFAASNAADCGRVTFHFVARSVALRLNACHTFTLLLFFAYNLITAQTLSKSVNLTFEYGVKRDFYKELQVLANSEETIKGRALSSAYAKRAGFQIGYTSSAHFSFEIGLFRQDFQIGWKLKKPHGIGSEQYFESANLFPIRISKKFFFLRKNLFIAPGCGYVLGFSHEQSSLGNGTGTTMLVTSEHVYNIIETFTQGKEYDVENFWGMLEIRSNIGYNFNKNLGIYLGGGIWFGNKIVGRTNVEYQIDSIPTGKIFNESKGSNFFFTGGITYAFSIL